MIVTEYIKEKSLCATLVSAPQPQPQDESRLACSDSHVLSTNSEHHPLRILLYDLLY